MLIVFTRVIIIYIFLLIAMRLMGKKQLGELQPFEFAVTLIVAELACIPMSDTTVPITYGLVPIFTLFVMHLVFSKIIKHSIKLRRVINGKPIVVIDNNGINYKTLKSLDMTINDLLESLRGQGYFSPSCIKYAVIETNGDLTVLPKAEDTPLTPKDLNIEVEQNTIPYMIICEGKLMSHNMQLSGIEHNLVDKILEKYDLKQKDILLLTIMNGEDIYLQAKNKPCITTTVSEVEND